MVQHINTDNIRNPTLYEVSQMREDWGLAGEEDTHLVVFLSFFGGGFVVMTGLSSGGKNAVVNSAKYCVPDNWVYQIPTSMSKTALYQKADTINSHPVHQHMDISSIRDKTFLEDIWKAHGEGRSITHSWTQVMGQEREERSQTLTPPNCMILFLAEDNEQVDLNDYAEIRNRALVVTVDDSKELTQKVNTRQAKERGGFVDYNLTEERRNEIRAYTDSIPVHMYGGSGSGGFLNPVDLALDRQNPLPQHFTEARRDFPRLMDFMESVTLFHYDDRMEPRKKDLRGLEGINNKTTLLVTPRDAWLAMRVFGEKMILSALNLRDKDFALLEYLRTNYGQQFDVGTLQQEMRPLGWNLADSDIRSSLKNMKTKGYVRVDKSVTPHEWTAAEFATQQNVSKDVQLDWPTIIEDTRKLIYGEHDDFPTVDGYPTDVAKEYEQRFLEGDGLLVTHPFEGHTVNLMEQEANELEEKTEQQEQTEEEVMDEGLYDSDDDDDNGGNQGTLL